MTEKKPKQSGVKEEPSVSRKKRAKGKSTSSGKDGSPVSGAKENTGERSDQIGSIVTKGFDLAEASINLGINLVNKIGSVAQDQIIEKLVDVGRNFTAAKEASPEEPGMEAPPREKGEETADTDTSVRQMHVENRLPLFPGSPLRVSFSISNDSVSTPKNLRLGIEGFTGEMRKGKLDCDGFVIKPVTKKIAPMDFDKFTLTGVIPPKTVSDIYSGWIIVTGDEQLRIPVRLTVSAGA